MKALLLNPTADAIEVMHQWQSPHWMAEVLALGQKLVWRKGCQHVDLTTANSISSEKGDASV